MSMTRRLDQLQAECQKLGLTPVASRKGGTKFSKEDCIDCLADHFLSKQFPGVDIAAHRALWKQGKISPLSPVVADNSPIPWHLQFMLSIESPMLCYRVGEYPCIKKQWKGTDAEWQAKQDELWTDPDVVAQEKENGVRLISFWRRGEGWHHYSRNISVRDYLPVEYDNIWLGNFDESKIPADLQSLVLDSELVSPQAKVNTVRDVLAKKGVVTETILAAVTALLSMNTKDSLWLQESQDIRLEFHSFHLLMANDNWLLDKALGSVLPLLDAVRVRLQAAGFNIVELPIIREAKKAFYQGIVNKGGEGVILKRLSKGYHPTESRHHMAWIKVKRSVKEHIQNLGLGDAVDAFVVGWEPGDKGNAYENLVGDLLLAVWLKKTDGSTVQHTIAKISNFELVERQRMTIPGSDGKPTLDPAYMGRVMEVEGQCVSARERRLVHPRMLGWRPDRSPETCVFDEAVLESLIL